MVKVYYLTSYGKHGDFLLDSVNINIWTVSELNIGIFSSSVATLRPLFRSIFQSSTFDTGDSGIKEPKSMDKNGFVKHISNSRGTNKIGGIHTIKGDGFEMYGSVIAVNGKKGRIGTDNESEENILPLEGLMAIRRTTEVTMHVMQIRREAEDRV
jgi:hypothetical protein